jgi:hypothetical protein
VNQYDALVLAVTQESHNLNVHKSDFTQVQEYANTVIIHLSPDVADIGRLNSATEPQARGVSVRLLFNLQHWSTIQNVLTQTKLSLTSGYLAHPISAAPHDKLGSRAWRAAS